MATIILLVILVLLAFWVIGAYNGLITLKNQVANAWKQIDVQLKRRHDLIPNLVNTVKGAMDFVKDHHAEPHLSNTSLFFRDRHMCAYCGGQYKERDLSRDHVIPVYLGGKDRWMNVVTACRGCNIRKGGRTPESSDMPLLYTPYVPNRYEHLILQNRRILQDQMEYLMAKVPKHSRLYG